MRQLRSAIVSTAVVALTAFAPAWAEAPPRDDAGAEKPVPNTAGYSAWGIAGWEGEIGLGGRYMLPIGDRGFLKHPDISDRLAAEVGLDVVHHRYTWPDGTRYSRTGLRPTAGVLWTVWLSGSFAFYPKFDLGYEFGWYSGRKDAWGAQRSRSGPFWEFLAGALYKAGPVALRIELGSLGLKAGVGIGF